MSREQFLQNQEIIRHHQQNEAERIWRVRMEEEQLRMLMEAAANQMQYASQVTTGGGAGSQKYITIIDTAWIYPIADLEYTIINTSVPFTREGKDFIFSDISDAINFYNDLYLRTEVTQPVGNAGYSLGVGTILQGTNDRIALRLATGQKVVEWVLMTQISKQSELPVGGNSPDGTVGYGLIYNDYDLDGVQDATNAIPPGFADPLRIQVYNG